MKLAKANWFQIHFEMCWFRKNQSEGAYLDLQQKVVVVRELSKIEHFLRRSLDFTAFAFSLVFCCFLPESLILKQNLKKVKFVLSILKLLLLLTGHLQARKHCQPSCPLNWQATSIWHFKLIYSLSFFS